MNNYKKSNRAGFWLEEHIAEKVKLIDDTARPAKNSGASGTIGDIYNQYFAIECKERATKHLKIDMDVWQKLINDIPLYSKKISFLALSNKNKEIFIALKCDDFFDLLYEIFETKEK